jgi:glutamate synthase (NADPH/NADH) small chain
MLQFTRLAAAMPDKRPAADRRKDFDEILGLYPHPQAAAQASRCSQCGVPYCQIHCPLGNNIPDWLQLAAEGRLEEAYALSSATNSFPEICGRICPQDRLCEGGCVLEQSGHGSVTIGSIERYITDTAWEKGWVTAPKPQAERYQSVGIIGTGPAGLAAADVLRRHGYGVHLYDRHDRAGGLLVYGIPNFKLEKSIVARRVALLEEAGCVFHLSFEVGRSASFEQLRRHHHALLIATGVYKARPLAVPGAGLKGVLPALDFLIASNRAGLGDKLAGIADGSLVATGKQVVVIGGGDTAMDCVRTAVRQGAKAVTCLYRRDRANMPGSQREVAHAEEEGVVFQWQAAPDAIIGKDKATAVSAVRMHLGLADASGRQSPTVIDGSGFTIPADMVVGALGFEPEDVPGLFGAPELTVGADGRLAVDERTMMTSMPGVFAAGDIVRGASLVVWAIKDGRDAAEAMHRRIDAGGERLGTEEVAA